MIKQKETYEIDHGVLTFRTNGLEVYTTKLRIKDGEINDPLLDEVCGAGVKENRGSSMLTANMISLSANYTLKNKDGREIKSTQTGYTI